MFTLMFSMFIIQTAQITSATDTISNIRLTGEGLFVTLIAVVGYFTKKKFNEYDKHLDDCHARNVTQAKEEAGLEQRMRAVERNIDVASRTIVWVGDCMVKIGAELKVDLPDRP